MTDEEGAVVLTFELCPRCGEDDRADAFAHAGIRFPRTSRIVGYKEEWRRPRLTSDQEGRIVR